MDMMTCNYTMGLLYYASFGKTEIPSVPMTAWRKPRNASPRGPQQTKRQRHPFARVASLSRRRNPSMPRRSAAREFFPSPPPSR